METQKAEIILTEDNPDDAELFMRIISRHGYDHHTRIFKDGEEVINYFENRKDNGFITPSLVFLDIKMPKVDGLTVLQMIKETTETKHIPVVMLTSSFEVCDINRAYQLGANAYLVKPVGYKEFSETIETAIRFWLNCNICLK